MKKIEKNHKTNKKLIVIISIIIVSLCAIIGIILNLKVEEQQKISKEKLLEQTGANTSSESKPNAPILANGMTPVKWNGTNWIVTNETDPEWYNYQNKQWANVMLQDELTYDENRNVTSNGSMYVWIPRYAYKIEHGYHTNEFGEIETVFLQGKTNVTAFTKGINGEITNKTPGDKNWLVPPAFTYDGEEIEGIWIAKYKARSTSEKQGDNIKERIRINNNKSYWQNISLNSAFSLCIEMNSENNEYGLIEDEKMVDPHLIKNTEWAAMAYLSFSDVGINSTISDSNVSTTGNETGIYEIAYQHEYTATYVNNDSTNLHKYSDVLINTNDKYRNILARGTTDTSKENYNMTSKSYGDAIYEISSDVEGNSWYQNDSYFPYGSYPVLIRGGNIGPFSFNRSSGDKSSNIGFRPVIIVRNVNENDIKITATSNVATNQPVKVQITFGETTLTNENKYQYRIDDNNWITIPKNYELIVSRNETTISARIFDGINTIKQVTYEINNIDKTAPNTFAISNKNIDNIHDVGFRVIDVVTRR